MLNIKRFISAVCAFTMAAALTGCIGLSIGSSKKSPSLGQELVDLKTALDAGAISPDEYERERGEILKRD
jgi:hypothetical protein